jgi:enamine deaminase RidA (YjgF/YER057c/UK114 family)
MRTLSPQGWPRGKGYSHGIEAEGKLVFVSGQVGWDKDMKFASLDFAAQLRQALLNTKAILAEAGARPEHVVRMTWSTRPSIWPRWPKRAPPTARSWGRAFPRWRSSS